MPLVPATDSLAVAHAFLVRVLADRDAGELLTLQQYQELFPGHEEEVARRYAEVTEPEDPGQRAAPGDLGSLGRFRLLRELGRGGQGIVYLAEDPRLNRQVALKVLMSVVDPDGMLLLRFRREAEAASRLDHPGICTVYEAGAVEGTPFMAMRYVEGESLARRILAARPVVGGSSGDAPEPEQSTSREAVHRIAHLIEQVARAVHTAHEAGVVHRDLKPGNIMITPDGDPVVLDFGLARAEGSALQGLTRTGDAFGTPAYMAPEQIEAEATDRRTDVYALGATLYECLTLRPPFEAPTREKLYRSILSSAPGDPRASNPAVPADLKVVLDTALAKDPDARYRTALELAEDLRRVREHEPIQARPVGPVKRLWQWTQRRPGLAAALVGVILSLSGALAVTLVYLREARLRLLPDLEQRAEEELWPAVPKTVPAMDAWLREAEGLGARADLPGLGELVEHVHSRREHALSLRRRSVGAHTEAWEEAIAFIAASEAYGGLVLERQLGLVPLGPDPDSGLAEFAYLQFVTPGTGSPRVPQRDPASGRLLIGEDTYSVLVLLPGGTFWMGAQSDDPSGPNYQEPGASVLGPVEEITLGPFFASKYELTQAQWLWATGRNPSSCYPGRNWGGGKTNATLQNPVEMVSWEDCADVLHRMGLGFPTEAQWEYACRAGTQTAWSTGDDPDSLEGYASLADEGSREVYTANWLHHTWDDDFIVHAPVGSFRPNPFGLHDMHGNVAEWCLDLWLDYGEYPVREGTGERYTVEAPAPMWTIHPYRGGYFERTADYARSYGRGGERGHGRKVTVGIRPAREVR